MNERSLADRIKKGQIKCMLMLRAEEEIKKCGENHTFQHVTHQVDR